MIGSRPGDVDGDGKADIILGLTNETDVVRGGTLVATQTIGAAAAARFTGVTPQALHAFDWNADGKAEVGVGDPLNNRTFVVFGGALSGAADVADRAKWIITGEIASDKFGFSISSGDLDTDSTGDLIVGVRQHNVTNHTLHFEDAGAVYVFYGVASSLAIAGCLEKNAWRSSARHSFAAYGRSWHRMPKWRSVPMITRLSLPSRAQLLSRTQQLLRV